MVRTMESTVDLPAEASPLSSYERYYAQKADGTVIGVYTNHDPEFRRFVLEECRRLDEEPFPCPLGENGVRYVEAGESVWLDDPRDLPISNGGGCAYVTIVFEPANSRFTEVECNGPY